jgi:hypothetical protein
MSVSDISNTDISEDTIMDAFRLGGWGMYPTLVAGLVLVGVAVWHAVKPDRGRVGVLVGLGIMTIVAGTLGFVTGVIATMSHVKDAADRGVALVGLGESLHNVALALALIMLATIAGTVGAFRLRRAA